MKLFEPKYRIIEYQDFDGKTWYKPQIKEHIFDIWGWYSIKGYSESYIKKDDAISKINEWKLEISKSRFKGKILNIIKL